MTIVSCLACFVNYHKTGVAPDWSHCLLLHSPCEAALNVMPITFMWPTAPPRPFPEGEGGRMTLNQSYSAFSHSGTATMCPNDVSAPLDPFPGLSSRCGPTFCATPFRCPRCHPRGAWLIMRRARPLRAAQAATCQVRPPGPHSRRQDTTTAPPNPVGRPHGHPTCRMTCPRLGHVLWPIGRWPSSA